MAETEIHRMRKLQSRKILADQFPVFAPPSSPFLQVEDTTEKFLLRRGGSGGQQETKNLKCRKTGFFALSPIRRFSLRNMDFQAVTFVVKLMNF